jgi:hypothetical protein
VAVVYVTVWARGRAARRSDVSVVRGGLKAEECAVLISFALYPLIVFALSVTVTRTFAERFALPAILGLSILPALLFRAFVRRGDLLLLVTSLLLCLAIYHTVQSFKKGRAVQTRYSLRYETALSEDAAVFGRLAEDSKIVMTDESEFLKTMRYGPPSVSRRLELLDRVESPTPAGRQDTLDMIGLGLRCGVGMPVVTLSHFSHPQEPFALVCCREKRDDRVRAALLEGENWQATRVGTFFADWPVFLMDRGQPTTDPQ